MSGESTMMLFIIIQQMIFFSVDVGDLKVNKVIIKRFDGFTVKQIKNLKQDIFIDDIEERIYFREVVLDNKEAIIKKLIIQ